MLARLERIEGILTAETDQAGDHLRLVVGSDTAAEAAVQTLGSLGYGAERSEEIPHVDRWFGPRAVGELSLIEAGVIADRVIPQLVPRPHGDTALLRAAVVAALHASFISAKLTSTLSGESFRSDCIRQAVAAATPIVGPTVAEEVGRLLDLDMRETHKMPRAE